MTISSEANGRRISIISMRIRLMRRAVTMRRRPFTITNSRTPSFHSRRLLSQKQLLGSAVSTASVRFFAASASSTLLSFSFRRERADVRPVFMIGGSYVVVSTPEGTEPSGRRGSVNDTQGSTCGYMDVAELFVERARTTAMMTTKTTSTSNDNNTVWNRTRGILLAPKRCPHFRSEVSLSRQCPGCRCLWPCCRCGDCDSGCIDCRLVRIVVLPEHWRVLS